MGAEFGNSLFCLFLGYFCCLEIRFEEPYELQCICNLFSIYQSMLFWSCKDDMF